MSVKKTVVLFVAVSREIISYRHVITSIYSRLQSSLNTFVTDYFLSHVFRRFETAHVHAHASRACQLARKPLTFSWLRARFARFFLESLLAGLVYKKVINTKRLYKMKDRGNCNSNNIFSLLVFFLVKNLKGNLLCFQFQWPNAFSLFHHHKSKARGCTKFQQHLQQFVGVVPYLYMVLPI